MKKFRFSEEQIAYALRMADGGMPVVDVCRQIGISELSGFLGNVTQFVCWTVRLSTGYNVQVLTELYFSTPLDRAC